MQIELIGCTCAGKSTLSRTILQVAREQGIDIFLGDDFVLKQAQLNWIKYHLPRTALVGLISLFACLITWQNNYKLYLFSTKLLFQLPISLLSKLNLLRNVLKKIGICEIIRFYSTNQQIILVDEGEIQIAHNLFVHVYGQVKAENLTTFVSLISLPDIIVYFKQVESLLIDRTIKRGHKRIPDRSYKNVSYFIKQAISTFDRLVQYPDIENKLLVIDSDQNVIMSTHCQKDQKFSLVSEFIRKSLICNNQQ